MRRQPGNGDTVVDRAPPLRFESLYAEHRRYVAGLMPRYGIHRSADCEDVAQAAWLAVHRKLGTYDPQRGSLRGWIAGIARGCAMVHRRSRARHPEVPFADVDELQMRAPDTGAQRLGRIREVLQDAVPDEQRREALVLQLWEGLSVTEIGRELGVSERRVEHLLAAARAELAAYGRQGRAPFLELDAG